MADTQREADFRKALEPFAGFADPRRRVPPSLAITVGSELACRQLTMGDCYAAADALAAHPSPEAISK